LSNFPRFLGFWEFPNHKFIFPICYQISLDLGNFPRSGTTTLFLLKISHCLDRRKSLNFYQRPLTSYTTSLLENTKLFAKQYLLNRSIIILSIRYLFFPSGHIRVSFRAHSDVHRVRPLSRHLPATAVLLEKDQGRSSHCGNMVRLRCTHKQGFKISNTF
jgi:hypothetical protein